MPFGLFKAPSTFTRLMTNILGPFLNNFVVLYFDDILIYNKSPKEHMQHMGSSLTTLHQHRGFLQLKECSFITSSVSYLGYAVSKDGIHMDEAKVRAIAIGLLLLQLLRYGAYMFLKVFTGILYRTSVSSCHQLPS